MYDTLKDACYINGRRGYGALCNDDLFHNTIMSVAKESVSLMDDGELIRHFKRRFDNGRLKAIEKQHALYKETKEAGGQQRQL